MTQIDFSLQVFHAAHIIVFKSIRQSIFSSWNESFCWIFRAIAINYRKAQSRRETNRCWVLLLVLRWIKTSKILKIRKLSRKGISFLVWCQMNEVEKCFSSLEFYFYLILISQREITSSAAFWWKFFFSQHTPHKLIFKPPKKVTWERKS